MEYKISVEEKSEIQRNINIEIPREHFSKEYDKALQKTASQVSLKGFRPGRAPKEMVQKLYGDKIHSEVLNEILSKAYQQALTEHSLNVVGYPEINIDDQDQNNDLRVTAGVSIYPQPNISDYMNLEFTAEVEEYTDHEIDHRLEHMLDRYAEMKPVEGRSTAEKGDLATIDYEGTIDGSEFPGSKGTNAQVEIGSGRALAAIEEGLVGLAVDESRQIEAVLPDTRKDEFAGKTASYNVTLKQLQQVNRPSFDDEFAKKTGMAETLPELREKLAEIIKKEIERKNEVAREDQLFRTLIEKHPFEVPQAMVDEESRGILFEMGLLDPRKEESYRFNIAPFRDGLREPAEFRVRRAIILSRVIEQEKVEFGEDDVDKWLNEVAEKEGLSREDINRRYGFPKNIARLKDMMASTKTVEKLMASAKISEKIKEAHDHEHNHD